jgi:tetratricopeptide (TPR) repeat protein/ADP-heptose:LPS heptosyltransferase
MILLRAFSSIPNLKSQLWPLLCKQYVEQMIVIVHRKSALTESMLRDALAHHRAGRLPQAARLYEQILTMDSRHPDSLHLLGMTEYETGHFENAADLIRKAIAINNQRTSYYANLGIVLHAQGKLEEAKTLYTHVLTLDPQLAEVHGNLGNVYQALGEFSQSIACYQRALILRPESPGIYNNLGLALQSEGKIEDAIACYQRALELRPNYTEVYYNLGNARKSQNKLAEAVEYYAQALTLKPDYTEAHYNLGNVLRAQGRLDEALMEYASALSIRPGYAKAAYGQALAQLLRGDFAVGWRGFERRWQTAEHDKPRAYSQPRWAAQRPVSGSVLIWGEQGIGDEIMFAGLIPDAVRTGTRCILDCASRLRPIFTRSFPGVDVVSGCDPQLQIVSQLPSGSLPGLFRTTISTFAATTSPYLVADPAKREQLRGRHADGGPLIGLAWHTNNAKTGRERSIDLSLLAPLFTRSDIRWVSLQYGDHDALEQEAEAAGAPILIDRSVDQLSNLDLFAAQIAAMDLVITIDNSTAHLAGALGVPVWVLLPFAPDWRWLLDREDSPWYPTMRLFRQPNAGGWQSVVQRVQKAIDRAWDC